MRRIFKYVNVMFSIYLLAGWISLTDYSTHKTSHKDLKAKEKT